MSATSNKKVRVAILGMGNCASFLVQGAHFYQDAAEGVAIPGLMHATLGGYHIGDIEFTTAFDVVEGKGSKDLSEAIYAYPNHTIRLADVPSLGIPVFRGMTHDGLGMYLSQVVKKAPGADGGYCPHPEGNANGRGGELSPGGVRDDDQVVC